MINNNRRRNLFDELKERIRGLIGQCSIQSMDNALKEIPDPDLSGDFYYDENTGKWLPKSRYTIDKLQSLIDQLFKGWSTENKVSFEGDIDEILLQLYD